QNAPFPDLEIYDANTDTWSAGAPIPVARKYSFGAALNGKFYVVGGSEGAGPDPPASAAVDIYDPLTDTWSAGVPMPSPRVGHIGGVIDGRLYITGGSATNG